MAELKTYMTTFILILTTCSSSPLSCKDKIRRGGDLVSKWIFGSGGLISLWLKTNSRKKLTRRECIAIQIIWQALTNFRQSDEPTRKRAIFITVGLLLFAVLTFEIFLAKDSWDPSCQNPTTRREWRSLNASQQQDYINAIQCLMSKPSQLEPETYRYDDFVYTHTKEGTTSHYAAAFLAWHRFFIHLYEKALKNECGFQGSLP